MKIRTACVIPAQAGIRTHLTNVTILGVLPDGQPDKGSCLIPLGDIEVKYAEGLQEFLLGRATFLSRFVLSIGFPERKFSLRLSGPAEDSGLFS
jgi:hypothetical protein